MRSSHWVRMETPVPPVFGKERGRERLVSFCLNLSKAGTFPLFLLSQNGTRLMLLVEQITLPKAR
jgi:hypothetical protein